MKTTLKLTSLTLALIASVLCGSSCSGSSDSGDVSDATLNISETFEGSLSPDDFSIDGVYYDSYIIQNVPAGASITASVTPVGFNAMLTFYFGDESNGDIIETENNEGLDGREYDTVYADEEGQYAIFVSSYSTAETGSYSFDYNIVYDPYATSGASSDQSYDYDQTCHSKSCGSCERFDSSTCSCVRKICCHLSDCQDDSY